MPPWALLALLAVRHGGYLPFPPDQRAWVWNICGALVTLALLVSVLWHRRGAVLLIGAWWAAEEAMVAGCGTWYLLHPWPIAPGSDICSSLIGTDLGKVSALALAILAFAVRRQPVRPDS